MARDRDNWDKIVGLGSGNTVLVSVVVVVVVDNTHENIKSNFVFCAQQDTICNNNDNNNADQKKVETTRTAQYVTVTTKNPKRLQQKGPSAVLTM